MAIICFEGEGGALRLSCPTGGGRHQQGARYVRKPVKSEQRILHEYAPSAWSAQERGHLESTLS